MTELCCVCVCCNIKTVNIFNAVLLLNSSQDMQQVIQGGPRKSSPPPICTCPCDILSLTLVIFSLWHL
jgi:hypothetical protein